MKARSPGKLILSGEHAVVYGRPALAMAVDRYAEAESTAIDVPQLQIRLGDRAPVSWAIHDVQALAACIDERHLAFRDHQAPVESVLSKLEELFAYCAVQVFDQRGLPASGCELKLRTDIPLGCGMGSSAALILATLRAMAGEVLEDECGTALRAEHLQHGRSSGLDVYTSARGGLIRFEEGQIKQLPPFNGPFCLVHTGTPEVSTGVCVQAVRAQFGDDAALWQAFAACTKAFEQGLQAGREPGLREPIMENHRLLVRIGVVPERVQAFVSEIEACGAAAKICGAGATKGDTAGMVFVYGEGEEVEACIRARYQQGIQIGAAAHGTQKN